MGSVQDDIDHYSLSKALIKSGKYLEDHELEHEADWTPYEHNQNIFKEPLFPQDMN